jgi:hypothetical protein
MRILHFTPLVALLFAGACTPGIRAGADFAPGLDMGAFSTFEWDEPDTRPVGDPRLENNPLFEARLHAAIERELTARGIRPASSGAGLTVHHHATVRDRVDVYEADRAAGYTTPEYGDGTQVVQYEEGTLMIDIADASNNELVWRGWAQFDIGRALRDPEVLTAQVDEAVAKMFEHFPLGAR